MTILYEIKDLSFKILDQHILCNISSIIQSQKVISIIGPNGSGKSTFLRILAGLERKYTGKISIQDKDLKTYSFDEKSKIISYQPQFSSIPDNLSIYDFVSLSRYQYLQNLNHLSDFDKQKVYDSIKICKINQNVRTCISNLSGGERQKVLIAECIAKEPKILLLDEPFTFLDIGSYSDISNILRDLIKTRHITIIIVTHDVNTAINYSDQIIGLKDGKMIFQKNSIEFKDNHEINELFSKQFKYLIDPISKKPIFYH